MGTYFARRMLLMIPTFIGITMLVFIITRFVPGGPIEQMMLKIQEASMQSGADVGGSAIEIPEASMAALNERFGLDLPTWKAYLHWLGDVLRLDFGTSFKFNEPVLDIIVSRFPISIYFGLIGFALAYAVCIPLGVLKAVRHGSKLDVTSSLLIFAGYSIPGWALGAVLLVFLGGQLEWVPLGGFRPEGWADMTFWEKVRGQAYHTVLPVLAYAAGSFATLTILMKNSLMENLGQDFVRTAFAKGLPERRVIFGHALRNSLIPICTGLGHAIGLIMAGSYLIEKVFNINGIGYLGYNSIVERDYAVVMGVLVINTVLILVGNILSDFLYVLVDPRIRFE
jgi:microcin C transport system permease protein